jgi:hypothetical protein
MKECPACRTALDDDAQSCPVCGGSYRPDGSFQAPWEVEMARAEQDRARKSELAERLGILGRPLPHLFLDSRSGCGVVMLAAVILLVAAVAGLVAAAS